MWYFESRKLEPQKSTTEPISEPIEFNYTKMQSHDATTPSAPAVQPPLPAEGEYTPKAFQNNSPSLEGEDDINAAIERDFQDVIIEDDIRD